MVAGANGAGGCVTRLRIGFAGNQNNGPFTVARALRAAGHDVRVLIDRPEPLNRPEFRYSDVGYPYPSWVEEIPAIELDDVVYRTPAWQTLLRRLSDRDVLVLNGTAFAAASDLPVPAICQITGSDLEFYCDPSRASRYATFQDDAARRRGWMRALAAMPVPSLDSLRRVAAELPSPLFHHYRAYVFRQAVARQIAGLRAARGVICLPAGAVPLADRLLDGVLRPGVPRVLSFMVESDRYRVMPPAVPGPLQVFSPARLNWSQPGPLWANPWENKRTDILVEAVALFARRTARPITLHLVEKGHSVRATRALIAALGIESCVRWHREMPQAEVIEHYHRAHVVADQFGDHLVGLAGYEAMAMGRPLLCNWRPEVFAPAFGETAPVAQARTPGEAAAELERLCEPGYRRDLADRGRGFVMRQLSPEIFLHRLAPVLSAVSPRAEAA